MRGDATAGDWSHPKLIHSQVCYLLLAVGWDLNWDGPLEHLHVAFLKNLRSHSLVAGFQERVYQETRWKRVLFL